MIKKIIILLIFLFLLVSKPLFSKEVETADLKLDMGSTVALVYYENTEAKGNRIVLTSTIKGMLEKSLTEIISIFDNTEKELVAKKSNLEISEVEIYVGLVAEGGVKIVSGSAEASFKIVLRPKAK